MQRLFIMLLMPFVILACQSENKQYIKLVNDMDRERIDEQIVVQRSKLEKKHGEIPEGNAVLLKKQDKHIPVQFDDMDGDGRWDELAFVYSFQPNEKVRLEMEVVPDSIVPEFESRTNIRFAKLLESGQLEELLSAERLQSADTKITSKKFQMEGPAWENDKVAYRNYFDRRNAMDIFGKKTDQMVLDSVGVNENYHELQDWGMDILNVGESLGAGSIALLINDSLYRICQSCLSKYQLVTEGPVRSVFELTYNDFNVDDRSYDLTHEISIWAGSYAYDSKVTLNNARGDERLVLGIVNMQSDSLLVTEHNEQFVSILTHDKQAFQGEYLGMSIVMDRESFVDTGMTNDEGADITQTYYAELDLGEDPVHYSFYAGWEKSEPQFKELDHFKDHIDFDASKKASPVKVLY